MARLPRVIEPTFCIASALACAAWVSVCAAAPEFLWRGLCQSASHINRSDIDAGLLIGLILACFIEPLLERLRSLLHGNHLPSNRSILFSTLIGLAFALAAVSLHEAMTALMSTHAGHGGREAAIAAGFALTLSLAAVPFAVTLVWLAAQRIWLAVPLALLAACSGALVGEASGWSWRDINTTTLPCLAILWLSRRVARRGGGLRSLAPVVAAVAMVWLGGCLLVDTVLDAAHLRRYAIYSPGDLRIDLRFYVGWVLGLVLVPAAAVPAAATTPRPAANCGARPQGPVQDPVIRDSPAGTKEAAETGAYA